MNKKQLANKIWQSANKMRSKIEAHEYKDYILGFIFYKFLSDKEVAFLKKDGYADEDIKENIHENNTAVVEYCQQTNGYFIGYDNLFSTWIAKGSSFTVDDVRTALSAFNRLISESHEKVFKKIFNTLETGLSKLGDTTGTQTKAISDLIQLIKDIPMDGRQDYDVLGFIYEYLISNFAANAGKKAGEFYTPHEVSQLMSEIVAYYLRGKTNVEIYDPTSGSGSLLITIGKSVAKYTGRKDSIKYYAQELKENTYNLTRMNLVMRDIDPGNIEVRCGDTLEQDWPMFDDKDIAGTYFLKPVDAVVSNPPYSQHWEPAHKETDPRYRYGMAPKGKADYAFLLHDLYHIKHDGVMTIVLPHGVLFRGDALGGFDGQGEGEGRIRRNLIENNNIVAIIGLPADIFFGTPIATIIMVLQKNRDESDVLFVDASKCFVKAGKKRKLRESDIRRIADTIITREDKDKFCRLVTKEEIRRNSYNLNIPRYVDSSEEAEHWDIYATMFGGLPNNEIDLLEKYWAEFPTLREELFHSDDTPFSSLKVDDAKEAVLANTEVQSFLREYQAAFADFEDYLDTELIVNMKTLNVDTQEDTLTKDIFDRVSTFSLIDRYDAYQLFANEWGGISNDLGMIQTEGFEAVRQVDPHMVIRKKNDKEEENQDGWEGHIIPFDLVQTTLLREQYDEVEDLKTELTKISAEITEVIDSIDEDDRGDYLNEENTAFVSKDFADKLKEIFDDVDTPELRGLRGYLALLSTGAKKPAKMQYINEHTEVEWEAVEGEAPYNKTNVTRRVSLLQLTFEFPDDSFEQKMVHASELLEKEKATKRQLREKKQALHLLTKTTIEGLSDEEAKHQLHLKWITLMAASLRALPNRILDELTKAVQDLQDKYAVTFLETDEKIQQAEQSLSSMIDELTGNVYDMRGLAELKSLLRGEENG